MDLAGPPHLTAVSVTFGPCRTVDFRKLLQLLGPGPLLVCFCCDQSEAFSPVVLALPSKDGVVVQWALQSWLTLPRGAHPPLPTDI